VAEILAGAEPASYPGGPNGVLVVHGFTGNPQSMRPLAQAFAEAGFATELPLLPGHGTSVEDMSTTAWADWSKAAAEAYDDLSRRIDKILVAGLSMGGALAVWLAVERPDVVGLVLVNPAIEPPAAGTTDVIRQMLEGGTEYVPGVGNDVADPGNKELAYETIPLASGLSFMEGQEELSNRLGDIRCPILLMTSRQDHVVNPSNSDYLADRVSGPVERVFLERSYHVATLDYDAAEIEARAVEFARKVTA
jgi:carboxylesterase